MLTHFGNFLCSLGEKGPFKTNAALWSVALWRSFFVAGYPPPSASPTGVGFLFLPQKIKYSKNEYYAYIWQDREKTWEIDVVNVRFFKNQVGKKREVLRFDMGYHIGKKQVQSTMHNARLPTPVSSADTPVCGARCAPWRRCACVAHRPRHTLRLRCICYQQRVGSWPPGRGYIGGDGERISPRAPLGRNDTSSVTACAVPPSPQGEGFGGRISPLGVRLGRNDRMGDGES